MGSDEAILFLRSVFNIVAAVAYVLLQTLPHTNKQTRNWFLQACAVLYAILNLLNLIRDLEMAYVIQTAQERSTRFCRFRRCCDCMCWFWILGLCLLAISWYVPVAESENSLRLYCLADCLLLLLFNFFPLLARYCQDRRGTAIISSVSPEPTITAQNLDTFMPAETYTTDSGVTDEENTSGCAICLEDYQFGECLRRFRCGHSGHGDCVNTWVKIKATCPFCRESLVTEHHEQRPVQDV